MQEKNGYQHRRLDGMRKQVINNPRYPHHVKVVRITYPDNDWLDDEPSEPTCRILNKGNRVKRLRTTTNHKVYQSCRGAHVCEDTRIPFLVACRNGLCWLPDVSGGKLQGFCIKRAQRA